MNIPKLSKRLLCAAQCVRAGARVADVGCDHGKLSAYLVLTNIASEVVATDINESPLKKAQMLFGALNIKDKARAVLCAGLDEVLQSEVDDIVIAGIGSDTISKIIADAKWLCKREKRLVLVPSSHHERLREYLYLNGFELIGETAVYDAGHCYCVMVASYCGVKKSISPIFAACGEIKADCDDARVYLINEKQKAERILRGTTDIKKRKNSAEIIEYIEKELL